MFDQLRTIKLALSPSSLVPIPSPCFGLMLGSVGQNGETPANPYIKCMPKPGENCPMAGINPPPIHRLRQRTLKTGICRSFAPHLVSHAVVGPCWLFRLLKHRLYSCELARSSVRLEKQLNILSFQNYHALFLVPLPSIIITINMPSTSTPIRKVIVVGGTGLTGATVVRDLVQRGFEVSILSRESSTAAERAKTLSGFVLPAPDASKLSDDHYGAQIIKTDYSHESLVSSLQGQDAVVSCIQHFHLDKQYSVIDAAIEAGVRRFIPSEYGCDTSEERIVEIVPQTEIKRGVVKYLQSKEDTGLSWTGVIVGGYLDSMYDIPGVFGVDLPSKTLTVYDGGDGVFDVTTMKQIGRAIGAVLSHEHLDETMNKYVHVNSSAVTQNQIFKILQDATGNMFDIKHGTKKAIHDAAREKWRSDPGKGPTYQMAMFEAIMVMMMDYGGFCAFSERKELWNSRLDLPKEDIEQTLCDVLRSRGLLEAR